MYKILACEYTLEIRMDGFLKWALSMPISQSYISQPTRQYRALDSFESSYVSDSFESFHVRNRYCKYVEAEIASLPQVHITRSKSIYIYICIYIYIYLFIFIYIYINIYIYTKNSLPERTSCKERCKAKSDSFPTIDMETIFAKSEDAPERIITNQDVGSTG